MPESNAEQGSMTPPQQAKRVASQPASAPGGNALPKVVEKIYTLEDSDAEDDQTVIPHAAAAPVSTPLTEEADRALRELQAELDAFDAPGDQLAAILTLASSWSKDREEDSVYQSQVRIEHNIPTRNRVIEAALQTDVFCVDASCKELRPAGDEKHTRLFEAVGHYIPNIVQMRNGQVTALEIEWLSLECGPDRLRMSHAKAPPHPAWVRYRLLNGKFAEVRGSRAKLPPFLKFPPLGELLGMHSHGIRSDISVETLKCQKKTTLSDPGVLFDQAVERAGGVDKVELLPYGLPTHDALSSSVHVDAWRQLRLSRGVEVTLPPVASYKEAIDIIMDAARQGGDPGIDDALDQVEKLISQGLDEPGAKLLYEQLVAELHAPPATDGIEPLEMWATPLESEDARMGHVYVDYDNAGVTRSVRVETDLSMEQEYEIPYPAFLAPDDCTTSALAVLARYTTCSRDVAVKFGSFHDVFEWYALSVTPYKHRDEAGTMSDGVTWYERMSAYVDYNGPVFVPRRDSLSARKWALLLNTTWLEELLLRGELRSTPKVYLYRGSFKNVEAVGLLAASPRGIGVLNGQLCMSPIALNRDAWVQDVRQDCRARFPPAVLSILMNHQDRVQVVNMDDYLEGLASLKLRFFYEGQSREVFYSETLRWDFSATTLEGMVRDNSVAASVTDSEGGVRLHLPVVPARSRKIAGTTLDEWGIPEDLSAPGWRVRGEIGKVPFYQIPAFSDKITVHKVGNWATVQDKMAASGISESHFRHLYSVHYAAANDWGVHPVVKYHNPLWTTSLKGVPPNRNWWFWPTSSLAPNQWFATSDSGQMPIYGADAVKHIRKKEQAARSVMWTQQHAVTAAPTASLLQRGRGRGLPGRGRSGWRGAARGRVEDSNSGAPPSGATTAGDPGASWW